MVMKTTEGKKCYVCGAKAYISGFDFDLCRAHRQQAVVIAKQAVKAFLEGAKDRHNVRLDLVDDLLRDLDSK